MKVDSKIPSASRRGWRVTLCTATHPEPIRARNQQQNNNNKKHLLDEQVFFIPLDKEKANLSTKIQYKKCIKTEPKKLLTL